MKWFRHHSDAHRKKGMMKLRQEYGAAGLGLYWYCLECIAAPIDKANISFELEHDAPVLAKELLLDTIKCEEMMRFMCRPDVGLFISDQAGGRIFCLELAHLIQNSIVKNPALKLIQDHLKQHTTGGQVTIDDILALPVSVGNRRQVMTSDDKDGKTGLEGEGDTDTTTTFSDSLIPGQPIAEDWSPDDELVKLLGDQYSVPEPFVHDYADRFRMFWLDTGRSHQSWRSKFIEQCSERWEIEKTKYMGGELVNWSPVH